MERVILPGDEISAADAVDISVMLVALGRAIPPKKWVGVESSGTGSVEAFGVGV